MSFELELRKGEKCYILKHYGARQWEYWLENEEGEGMSVSEPNLFDVIDKYFKEEF